MRTHAPSQQRARQSAGVALVAVLSVLTVLALLGVAYVTMLGIHTMQANEREIGLQLELLLDAGYAHGKAMLWDAHAPDGTNSPLYRALIGGDGGAAWQYVTDHAGRLCGRYRLRYEDEAGKVNINKAWRAESPRGSAWDTGEINLARALGVSPAAARRLIQYRYGPNGVPGARGDDVAFAVTREATEMLLAMGRITASDRRHAIRRYVHQRATLYACDEPGSATLPNDDQRDINCMSPRECRRMLSTANMRRPFMSRAAMADQLAANIVDYRDENHVLSTIGQVYGVEAVCFNEVLANDASYAIHPDLGNSTPGWTEPSRDQWRDRYGSSDSRRTLYRVDSVYDCVPDDPGMNLGEYYYNLDPRAGWRIANTNTIRCGDLAILGASIRLTFPKVPGENGNGAAKITPYNTALPPQTLPGGKTWCNWPGVGSLVHVFGQEQHYTRLYDDMLDVLRKLNMTSGTRPKFPNNYFVHAQAMVYTWGRGDANAKAIGCFEITASDDDSITFRNQDANTAASTFRNKLTAAGMSQGAYDLSLTINAWGNRTTMANVGETCQTFLMRAREPLANRYYQVVIGRPPKGRFTNGYSDELGVSGEVNGDYTRDADLHRAWWYQDGKPQRTKAGGWLSLLLQASPDVTRNGDQRQLLSYFRMVAPEVTEMYNAAMTPVSLANWRVICNTGSLASEIGRIRNTTYFDRLLGRAVANNNPVIAPGGHFYLVNDTALFDYWYGNQDGVWGSSRDEEVPVFQMDKQNWGISYKIASSRVDYPASGRAGYVFMLQENQLDTTMFDLETVRFVDEERSADASSWNGIFAPVKADEIRAKNEIFIEPIGDDRQVLNQSLVGKSLMILGLPHKGGIVSLTLKNEYDQICARTVDYGKVEAGQLGYSSQKTDPTKGTWVVGPRTSINGVNALALNPALRARKDRTLFIKNGLFCSVGETRHVAAFDEFERLAMNDSDVGRIAAIADVAACAHVRLDAVASDVTRVGWQVAADTVADFSAGGIVARQGGWEPDQWKGQTLRFLSGALRGEKFPVYGNTTRGLALREKDVKQAPYSAPGRMPLRPAKGDQFSIGPGYATPLCYTRTSNESGEWHWHNVVPARGAFDVYIYGLNDAIATTEFLEENNNASLDVEVWNYRDLRYDRLCARRQYGKQDSFLAGTVQPAHISERGDIKLRLTAHDVTRRGAPRAAPRAGSSVAMMRTTDAMQQSGFAWFNYAVLAPVPVPGRVNANTASEQLLASLPGVTPVLARNIAGGVNRAGVACLKPYRRLGDLLAVRGMTASIFERCANVLAVDSSVMTVDVEAQVLKRNGTKPEEATAADVVGCRRMRTVFSVESDADGRTVFTPCESYLP
jgi:type II secretory pathway component PulK